MISLSYDPKVSGFMTQIDNVSSEILENEWNSFTLIQYIDDTWENRRKIMENLAKRIPILQERAQTNITIVQETLLEIS